jgi:hypothetical protein
MGGRHSPGNECRHRAPTKFAYTAMPSQASKSDASKANIFRRSPAGPAPTTSCCTWPRARKRKANSAPIVIDIVEAAGSALSEEPNSHQNWLEIGQTLLRKVSQTFQYTGPRAPRRADDSCAANFYPNCA